MEKTMKHEWLNTSPETAKEAARLQLEQLTQRMSKADAATVATSRAARKLNEGSFHL